MNTQTQDAPRIYVGTYRKYNNGSIAGKWLELEDYAGLTDNHVWKRTREWGPKKPKAKPTEAEESGNANVEESDDAPNRKRKQSEESE